MKIRKPIALDVAAIQIVVRAYIHNVEIAFGADGSADFGAQLGWGSTPISRTVVKELQPSDPAWPPFAA
ncbi:hypothetical protein KWH10_04360, partial [Xanthomonas campestris pv. clerodendri]|nr:hypothetical protein [Xanthomonas campestris pv. clerodendri]